MQRLQLKGCLSAAILGHREGGALFTLWVNYIVGNFEPADIEVRFGVSGQLKQR